MKDHCDWAPSAIKGVVALVALAAIGGIGWYFYQNGVPSVECSRRVVSPRMST